MDAREATIQHVIADLGSGVFQASEKLLECTASQNRRCAHRLVIKQTRLTSLFKLLNY